MAMTLSPTPSSAVAPGGVNVTRLDLCAVVCAGSAGVHAALVTPHAAESTAMALAFAAASVALAAAAAGLVLVPTATSTAVTAALLLAVATAYLLSRTAGLPGLTVHTEPFDILGTVVSSLEVAAALVVLRHPTRRHT